MNGICPDDWHGTTEADLQQMSWGEDYWLFGGEVLSGYVRPNPALAKENRAQYAIHDRAIELAKAAGKTFHLLPDDQQALLWDIAKARGETA